MSNPVVPDPTRSAAAEPKPRPPSGRGVWRTWFIGALIAAVVTSMVVILVRDLQPKGLPASAAGRFVPADAFRYQATFTEQRTSAKAMVETTRTDGLGIIAGISSAAFLAMDEPAGGVDAAHWWREATIPGDPTMPSRYRIRSIDADGVWLKIQDWGDLGLSFARFLELPADVAAGQTWTSSGTVLGKPVDDQLSYQNLSSASSPVDSSRAAAGCLQVTSITDLRSESQPDSAERWQENNLWCPGQGVVHNDGRLRGDAYEVTETADTAPVPTDALRTDPLDVSNRGRWVVRDHGIRSGDLTFGDEPATISVSEGAHVAGNGLVTFLQQGGIELSGLIPLRSGEFWWHWWVRPGGSVVSSTVIGSLVVVTTTQRRLLAYSAGGRLRWSSPLHDVAVAPPLAIGEDRLAVATVDGSVAVIDATTGVEIWRRRLTNAVHDRLASNGSVLVTADTGPTLTAWDLATGEQRWQVDAGNAFQTITGIDSQRVFVGGSGVLEAYDLTSGDLRWQRKVGLGLTTLSPHGDQLWVTVDDKLLGWSAADGHDLWQAADAGVSAVDGLGCRSTGRGAPLTFVLHAGSLQALDETGATTQSWPVAVPDGSEQVVQCAGGRVWVLSYFGDGSGSLSLTSVGPPG